MSALERPGVLVLCHANRWRSPLAAAVLAAAAPGWEVRSAGFKPDEGRPAARPIRLAAAERGYDLAAHRSQRVTEELAAWARVVVYMDGGNLLRLAALCREPAAGQQWVCLARFANQRSQQQRIPDPAWVPRGGPELRAIVDLIEQCARSLAARLPELAGERP